MTIISSISFYYKVSKTYLLIYFIVVSLIVSYIDSKRSVIPDKIIFPAFIGLLILKYIDNSLIFEDLIAVVIVLIVFIIPIVFNMAFGGGDLRFGAFCALFLGLEPIGWFVLLSALVHLCVLMIIKKKSFGFAPAMSLGALGSYMIGIL